MILTPDELELLTGRTARAQKRYGSQAKVLDSLGITHLTRPDGTLIVFRQHVDGQTPKIQQASPTLCPI